jgi:hypothetical protein
MAKFPEPPSPAALRALGADLHPLPAGTRIWRIYFQAGDHPTTWSQFRSWGPTDARFDHHLPPPGLKERGILYGAAGPQGAVTALAEVFQAARVVERERRAPTWVAFDTSQPLRLLDLTGTWPTRAGASMAIGTGPRARARRWSQAIYEAFPDLDGLWYGSSMHANQPCLALYERARRALPERPVFHRMLADPVVRTLLRNACGALNDLLD